MTTTAPFPAPAASADVAPRPTRARRVAAWSVHAYTASGALFGFLFLLAGLEGDYREAFAWAAVAFFVDGTDGMLARAVDVKRVVPEFDGALLDNIVDYLTYCFVPVVVLHQGGFLPDGGWGYAVAAAPLLASCYQFCRCDAKEGHLFWGFPDYWNVVLLYAVLLDQSVTTTTVVVLVCSVLVFVPLGYLYPTRSDHFRRTSLALSALWGAVAVTLVFQLPDPDRTLTWLSLTYVVFYVGASLECTRRVNAGLAPTS